MTDGPLLIEKLQKVLREHAAFQQETHVSCMRLVEHAKSKAQDASRRGEMVSDPVGVRAGERPHPFVQCYSRLRGGDSRDGR